jgi:hypothetical protein
MFLPAQRRTKIDKFNVILITEGTLLVTFACLNMPIYCIVTWRLKAGTVESEMTAIARQRLVETRSGGNELSWQRIWAIGMSITTS